MTIDFRGSSPEGCHNSRIRSAAADIALHELCDLCVRRVGICFQQGDAGHDHARRAKRALHRAFVKERLLQRMEFPVRFEPFDRCYLPLRRRSYAESAGMARVAVNQHRASAALAFTAAVFAPRQVKLVTQDAEQGSVRRGVNFVTRSIDLDFRDSC